MYNGLIGFVLFTDVRMYDLLGCANVAGEYGVQHTNCRE